MKHCKYSKTKEVRPYMITETTIRCNGVSTQTFYSITEEGAKWLIELRKSGLPKPNSYYLGTEFRIEFIGNDKLI